MYGAVVKRNLANLITITRPIFAVVIWNVTLQVFCHSESFYLYSLLYAMAWISDYTDGRVARRLGISSEAGAVLDLLADCFFVFLLNIQVVVLGLVPMIFLLIMVEKILNYITTSKIMNKIHYSSTHFRNDKIGRVVSASFFVIPWAAVFIDSTFHDGGRKLILMGLICVIVLSVVSSLYRYYETYKAWKNA